MRVHSNQRCANGRIPKRTVLKRLATSDQDGDNERRSRRAQPGATEPVEITRGRPPIPMRSSGRCLYRRQHGTRLAGLRDAGGRPPTVPRPSRCLKPSGTGVAEITRCAQPTSGKCEKPQRSVQSGSALSFALQSATRYNPEPTPTATLANVTHTDGNYGARELT